MECQSGILQQLTCWLGRWFSGAVESQRVFSCPLGQGIQNDSRELRQITLKSRQDDSCLFFEIFQIRCEPIDRAFRSDKACFRVIQVVQNPLRNRAAFVFCFVFKIGVHQGYQGFRRI